MGYGEQLKNWKANSFLHCCSPTCHNIWASLEDINLVQGTAHMQITMFSTSESLNTQCLWSNLPVMRLLIMRLSPLPALDSHQGLSQPALNFSSSSSSKLCYTEHIWLKWYVAEVSNHNKNAELGLVYSFRSKHKDFHLLRRTTEEQAPEEGIVQP